MAEATWLLNGTWLFAKGVRLPGPAALAGI